MPFPSYLFLFVFLPVALAGYFLCGRRGRGPASWWLAGTSLLFYAANDLQAVTFLLFAIIVTHYAAWWLAARYLRLPLRRPMMAALVLLAGAVMVWKACLPSEAEWTIGTNAAPWAFSFILFFQAAYLWEVARSGGPASRDWTIHARYSLFFPRLPAGPPQPCIDWVNQRYPADALRFQPANAAAGLSLFACGLAKKVVMADSLSLLARHLFDDRAPGAFFAWAGALAFAFQLYFELSGYADMALGIARMFNVALPPVFDAPYRARTVSAFWSRWYAPLWNFGRDLAALFPARARAFAPPLAFVALGSWHGPTPPFLAWGAWSGLCLAVQRSGRVPLPAWAGGGLTFLAVLAGWVVFRSSTLPEAGAVFATMAGLGGPAESPARQLAVLFHGSEAKEYALAFLALAASPFLALLGPTSERLFGAAWRPTAPGAAAVAVLLVAAVLFLPSAREFLYAHF